MAVHHYDIRKLREEGIVGEVWTGKEIAPHVQDNYPTQTIANQSACPCGKEKGHHCQFNTKSHRFIRLGNGRYCLPAESPDVCPIHNGKSNLSDNYYIKHEGLNIQNNAAQFDDTPNKLKSLKVSPSKTSPISVIFYPR